MTRRQYHEHPSNSASKSGKVLSRDTFYTHIIRTWSTCTIITSGVTHFFSQEASVYILYKCPEYFILNMQLKKN